MLAYLLPLFKTKSFPLGPNFKAVSRTATFYSPSSTVPNPQTPSKCTLSSTSHIVFPTGANLPANSISPL